MLNAIIYLHMPSRLLYHYRIVINNLIPVRWSREQKVGKKLTIAASFATPSRSISSRPFLPFLDICLLRKVALTPLLTGKHSESLLS